MTECDYCGEDFEDEESLHLHWLEEHEDEITSHEKDDAKKTRREKKEKQKEKKEKKKKYLYQGVGAAVIIGLAALIGPQIINSVTGPSTASNISIADQPMIGNESAEVTLVEFGDFQCPACSSFESGTYQKLKSEYIDTGKVNFVWKDFPLESLHPWARTGAETMECVYRENETAFWNVKSTLFEQQGTLNQGNVQSQIIEWAGNEGVNAEAVRSCAQSGGSSSAVTQDQREGRTNQVTSTPTILVNGEQVGNSYQEIQAAIESELEN
jgi:protein-disulfide isomerase